MQSRNRSWREPLLALAVVLLALTPVIAQAGASHRSQQRRGLPLSPENDGLIDESGDERSCSAPRGDAFTAKATSPVFATLEDTYDAEAGDQFQAALGFVVFQGTPGNVPKTTYGVGIDDMTVEWSEEHPIEQTATEGCGNKTCTGGPRAGKLCFNTDDCGAGGTCGGAPSTSSACAALTWGVTNLFSGSGNVTLDLVDFNAETTQGGFSCLKYGFTVGCGGGSCASSNDCDNDGLEEVEVSVRTSAEPVAELFRLEQTSSGSASYTGQVAVSSAINAPNDGVVFMQFNGALTPSLTAYYFDRDSGAGDANGDGTLDGPPSAGRNGCPGFCNVDDDQDAAGDDKRGGFANVNDDGNGTCDFRSGNAGANCVRDADCTGGSCLNIDESDEHCSKVCTSGTTAGLCSPNSFNPGTACAAPGTASSCTNGGTCVANQCAVASQCGAGGACGATALACGAGATIVAGRCQRGEDNCNNIDEPDELCPIVGGKLASGIDDNCGCASNPVTSTLTAQFDVADIIVAGYTMIDDHAGDDNDGFADTNELVDLELTLRNVSDFVVENVTARLTTQSANIACINDPTARYGRIDVLQSVTNTTDQLQFTVANVNRAAVTDILQAQFVVTVTGTALLGDGSRVPFEGTAVPQRFVVDLDLDVNGAAPPPATTSKTFSFEPGQYGTDAAWETDWAHAFVPNQLGLHCQYNNPSNPGARTSPAGCFLRQDPGTAVPDDWHLHSTVSAHPPPDGGRDSGAPGSCIAGGFPGNPCETDFDCPGKCAGGKVPGESCYGENPLDDCRGACSGNAFVRCSTNTECSCLGLGKCSNPAPGTCTAPVPGTCGGLGNSCMHFGLHGGGTVEYDTIHLDNMTYATYKPTIQVGMARAGTSDIRPTVDFWHQMSLSDDRMFTNVDPPFGTDAGVVHVLVDRNSNGIQEVGPPADPAKDGWWEKVIPFYGAPVQQRMPFGNCSYDPIDDGNSENDISDSSPTFLFSAAGTVLGPSSTCFPEFVYICAGDTQDPPYDPLQGQIEPSFACFPEVAANGSQIFREGPGPGRWIEGKIDLYPYRGRQIWFRFFTSTVQLGFTIWTDGFGGPFGGNRDDGWYIDDVKITGLNATPFTLKPDTDAPPSSSCPNPATCLPIAVHLSGSTFPTRTDGVDNDGDAITDESDEGGFLTVLSDAPLRNVILNGQDSANPTTTAGCLNGVLQYRFSVDENRDGTVQTGEVFRDWTENPHATAHPVQSSKVVLEVRCSALTSCRARGVLEVVLNDMPVVYFEKAAVAGLSPEAGTNHLEWTPVTGAASYDVITRQGIPAGAAPATVWLGPGGYFDSMICRTPAPQTCNDADLDGLCEYSTLSDGNPTAGTIDLWLARRHGGSWEELNSTLLPPTTTRDSVLIDSSPVCP